MKITSSTEYATRLMVMLARAYPQGPMPADRLSESENVPVDFVNQLLMRLRRAGLIESHRGTGGGYVLSRPPDAIKLGQVLRAVEGRIFEDVCEKYSAADRDCHHQGHCSISPVWQKLGALIEQYFDGIALSELLDEKPGSCGKVEAMLGRIPLEKL